MPPTLTLPTSTELSQFLQRALQQVGQSLSGPTMPIQKKQVIDFLYATNRRPSFDDSYYSGERSETVSYGTVSVRIPEDHLIGKLERPFRLSLFGLTFFEESLNSHKHFIIENIDVRTSDDWRKLITSLERDRALVFVHGFNTNFRDSALRSAQIFWDLQYSGVPVLFSWPSRGAVLDYLYDRDSALISRDAFIATLRDIRSAGIRRIDILAHSMGNLLVLEGIAAYALKDELGIAEVLSAAPDVAKDHYKSVAAKVRPAVSGMTLYASSADRALATSKRIAGNVPRAGDVPDEGPVTVEGVDTIDVTAIGSELFGLGHGPFASARSILDDIGLIISTGTRPPNRRLVQIRGMPSGDPLPKWWRYTY
jgi:esterase/lipase superfamily enzyme